MKVSIDPKQRERLVRRCAARPDSVIARSRAEPRQRHRRRLSLHATWRTFYRDDTRRQRAGTTWPIPSVAMPNVLCGRCKASARPIYVEEKDPRRSQARPIEALFEGWRAGDAGRASTSGPVRRDRSADLVAYLQWMGEPAQNTRVRLGVWVLLFLGVSHRHRLAPQCVVLARRQINRRSTEFRCSQRQGRIGKIARAIDFAIARRVGSGPDGLSTSYEAIALQCLNGGAASIWVAPSTD